MLRELRQLQLRLLNFVGVAHLHAIDDSGDQQVAQMQIRAGGPEGVEEVIDKAERLAHYGFAYCPPDGSEAVVLFVGGRRSSGIIIADGHKASRLKDLKPGEAALYNGLTGAFVKMCQDGKIRSKADWFHDGLFHATGNVTSEKDVIDHTAPDATGGVSLKTLRDDYNAHTHGGVQAGASSTNTTDHPAT